MSHLDAARTITEALRAAIDTAARMLSAWFRPANRGAEQPSP